MRLYLIAILLLLQCLSQSKASPIYLVTLSDSEFKGKLQISYSLLPNKILWQVDLSSLSTDNATLDVKFGSPLQFMDSFELSLRHSEVSIQDKYMPSVFARGSRADQIGNYQNLLVKHSSSHSACTITFERLLDTDDLKHDLPLHKYQELIFIISLSVPDHDQKMKKTISHVLGDNADTQSLEHSDNTN